MSSVIFNKIDLLLDLNYANSLLVEKIPEKLSIDEINKVLPIIYLLNSFHQSSIVNFSIVETSAKVFEIAKQKLAVLNHHRCILANKKYTINKELFETLKRIHSIQIDVKKIQGMIDEQTKIINNSNIDKKIRIESYNKYQNFSAEYEWLIKSEVLLQESWKDQSQKINDLTIASHAVRKKIDILNIALKLYEEESFSYDECIKRIGIIKDKIFAI